MTPGISAKGYLRLDMTSGLFLYVLVFDFQKMDDYVLTKTGCSCNIRIISCDHKNIGREGVNYEQADTGL